MRGRRWLSWFLYALWIGIVVTALLVPTDRMPRIFWAGLDKVAHTAMFTVMGALGQAAAPWIALVISLSMAVGLELVQKSLPYRTYDTVELLANVTGVLVGVICFELGTRLRRS